MLKIISTNENTITVENTCPFCGKARSIQVAGKAFMKWQEGELIQNAMPNASADDRELLMTGMCDDCFPKDPDD